MKIKSKILLLVVFALALSLFAFAGCDKKADDNTQSDTGEELTLNYSAYSLDLYEQVTLSVTSDTEGTVEWTTSDASVATVADGVVTSLKNGTATITAAVGSESATCTITVQSTGAVPVMNGLPESGTVTLEIGGRYNVEPQINYKGNDVEAEFTYQTDDAQIATFENGVITAVAAGTVTVTVSAQFYDYSLEQSIEVTVLAA